MQAFPIETEYNEEEQLRIVVDSAHIEIAAHETVSTSEPSTSDISRSDSYASVISAVGPLRAATPHKKFNRPKP